MEPSSSSSSSKDKSKNRHQRHWSKKFISDDEEEFQGMLLNNNQQDGNGGDEFDYSEKKISFEDEKLARHSRGESYTNKSSRGHSRIPSLISSINDNIPFRVSVDSTADLARHKVNPPTTYLPPGMDENDNSFSSNHNHSMEESSFHSSNSKQTIKDHISRDSLGSNLSGYSNQQGESFSDSLRSGLPPLKTSNVGDGEVDGYGNDRRQSLKSTTSSHSSYGSPIESSNSNKPIGGRNSFATTGSSNHQSQEKIGRITSPLGRTRVSNPNLSSSFKETDGRIENLQGGDESQLDSNSISRTNPQYHPFRHQHRSQQFSSSSTVSSNFSNGISSSSPSRPPSAPPISNTSSSTTNRYSSNPNTNERYNDQVGGSFTNSVPTSPQQSFRSINQNQFSPISEPLDRNRSSFSSTPLLSEQDQSQLTQQSSSSTTQFDRSTSISQSRSTTSSSNRNPFVSPQPFLTIYRSHMMLMTVICILAVDFRIFPREFAKCETYGTSLMDLGVGSFVFSLGLISALPILKSPRNRFKPLRKQLLTSLRKSLPLLVIGGIRVLLVKGVDYHEHISEYGLHWNFFITLGLLPILTILISKVFSRFFRFNSIGLTIGIVYQLLLSLTSLESFVISNDLSDRTNLFSQNKEGIFSLFGYLSIFLIGLDLGFYVLPLDPYFAYRKLSKTRRKPKTEKLIMILFSFSIIWWFSFGGLSLLGMKVSRRLANLSYVIWVAAFNTSFITAYTCVYWFWLRDLKEEEGRVAKEIEGSQDHDHDREKDHVKSLTPAILDALNSHSFTIFLVVSKDKGRFDPVLFAEVFGLCLCRLLTSSSLDSPFPLLFSNRSRSPASTGQSIDRSHQSFNQDDSHRSDPFDSDLDALSLSLHGSRCSHGAKGLENQVLISYYSLENGFES